MTITTIGTENERLCRLASFITNDLNHVRQDIDCLIPADVDVAHAIINDCINLNHITAIDDNDTDGTLTATFAAWLFV
jgi:hypothetical protein